MATKFNKYQYVELQIAVGQQNPGFTPQQYLQNRQVYAMESFNSADVSETRSNLGVITPAMMEGMFLNLYCTDVELPLQAIPNSTQKNGQGWGLWFRDVPLVALHRIAGSTNPYVRDLFEMYGEYINFEQSYVNVNPAAAALITAGGVSVCAVFGVSYK